MKKIIPILSLIGASALIVGASNLSKPKTSENFIHYFNSFQNDVSNFANIDTKLVSTALNNYALSLDAVVNTENSNYCPATTYQENAEILPDVHPLPAPELANKTGLNDNTTINSPPSTADNAPLIDETPNNNINNTIKNATPDNLNINTDLNPVNENTSTNDDNNNDNINNEENIEKDDEKVSTLYSLSNDITEGCDIFCQLKTELHNAIVETQALIEKVNNNEISLTNEQKLLITEQAQQLKNLGRQLSNSTTELALSLSDLNTIMQSNNQNLNDLSLKYLIVLDNLVNGNEMLHSSLETMRLMNQIFNINTDNIPSNNKGRILYGFQENNNPPVIKDYYIDENNNLQENNTETNEKTTDNYEKTNIDTYKDRKLQSNIDTYQNSHVNRNIDTFFNTALLDNEFMYGNGNGGMYGYGYNGYAGNPYVNNYSNYERGNTNDSVNKDIDTQNKDTNMKNNSKRKKFKLTKNVDTYKDENTPNLKSKIDNIKSNIGEFFSKFSKTDLDNKIDNPIYKYNSKNEGLK